MKPALSWLPATAGARFGPWFVPLQDLRAPQLQALPGAELVAGSSNALKTAPPPLAGIERAFLLTNPSELAAAPQLAFVDLARQAGAGLDV